MFILVSGGEVIVEDIVWFVVAAELAVLVIPSQQQDEINAMQNDVFVFMFVPVYD